MPEVEKPLIVFQKIQKFVTSKFINITISMTIHVSTQSADYWACDTLGEINLHQQWHRPSGVE